MFSSLQNQLLLVSVTTFLGPFFFYKTVEISDDSNVSLLLIGLESISYKIYKNIFMLVFFCMTQKEKEKTQTFGQTRAINKRKNFTLKHNKPKEENTIGKETAMKHSFSKVL